MHAELLQDLVSEHLRVAWRIGKGEPLEAYYGALSKLGRLECLPSSLIEEEMLARYQLPWGDTPSPEHYRQRFPDRRDVDLLLADRFIAGGRYVRLHTLGLGATGEVFSAYDRELSRRVAIKRPRREKRHDGEIRRQFSEEARLTAALEHPGIVGIHECLEDNDGPYHVMRLVTGQTLGERIRKYYQRRSAYASPERIITFAELVRSTLMVADALTYAHAHGVLHCDLKPGNILAGECGEVVILDWGSAQRIGPGEAVRTSSGREMGTPEYMPPEQADGIADVRSDIFGIGAILYELLAGVSPHGWMEEIRPPDWRQHVRDARFKKPHSLQSGVPRALEGICLRALDRVPDNRYQTTAEVALELRRYLSGHPVGASGGVLRRLVGHFGAA